MCSNWYVHTFFIFIFLTLCSIFFLLLFSGSGKTAAFLIPTLSALFTSAKELQKPRPAPYQTRQYRAEPLVLIIAPTRELCSQIFDECRRVSNTKKKLRIGENTRLKLFFFFH